jgi:hypothetical protein
MVMSTDPAVIEEEQVDSGEVDADVDEGLPPIEDEAEPSVEAGPTDVAPPKSIAETPTAQPTPPTAPSADQQAINELHQRRAYDMQQKWQQSVGKQARSYEQKLQESGYMPEQGLAGRECAVKTGSSVTPDLRQ